MNIVNLTGIILEINPGAKDKSSYVTLDINEIKGIKDQPVQVIDRLRLRVPAKAKPSLSRLSEGDAVEVQGHLQGCIKRPDSGFGPHTWENTIVVDRIFELAVLAEDGLKTCEASWLLTGTLVDVSRENDKWGWLVLQYGPRREKRQDDDIDTRFEFVNAVRIRLFNKKLEQVEQLPKGSALRVRGQAQGLLKRVMGTDENYMETTLTGQALEEIGMVQKTIFRPITPKTSEARVEAESSAV